MSPSTSTFEQGKLKTHHVRDHTNGEFVAARKGGAQHVARRRCIVGATVAPMSGHN
jgi:hypothetical protein